MLFGVLPSFVPSVIAFLAVIFAAVSVGTGEIFEFIDFGFLKSKLSKNELEF